MDFAIGLMLFTFTLVAYFSYTNNFQNEDKGSLNLMLKDAKSISSSLILDGYPDDWDSQTAVRIGVTDDQKLNGTKLRRLKQLNYTSSRKKFATSYDYFVYFVNGNGEVLNVDGVCGAGYPLINLSYNIKSAYYYSDNNNKFLLNFMNNTLKADIYFGDSPSDDNDIDSLKSNLSKYGFLMMEHPALSGLAYNRIKDAINNFSSSGNSLTIGGEFAASQGETLAGVSFYKKPAQSASDRNSTINNKDNYLSLNIGDNILFSQANYAQNTSNAAGFSQIASFNADGENAISGWQYGNGTVYFFSDFNAVYSSGDFAGIVQDLVQNFAASTCSPINISLSISPKNLAKTERYLNYNSKVAKMVVYVWE